MRLLLTFTAALTLLAACAPEHADRYTNAETDTEVVGLLNARRYGKAIFLLESRVGKDPAGEPAFLLAQAYLGRAGFEPLAFAAAVAGPMPENEAARALFPECDRTTLAKVNTKEWKCLLKRVYLQAPAADGADFARARLLLRRAYPDPAAAPEWVNSLVGLVETVSLVRRAGDLFLYADAQLKQPSPERGPRDLPWLKKHTKEALVEGEGALQRAKYSGEKVSRLLTGAKAYDWFERVEGGVAFAKALGLPRFMDFLREQALKPGDEIRYGETLDQIRDLLASLEKPAA